MAHAVDDNAVEAAGAHADVLIIGGGHAGAQMAIGLSQLGYAGSIGIITDEPELPYERPPLSKDYLGGEKPFERLLIRQPEFWAERGIRFTLGKRIARIFPAEHRAETTGGERYSYGTLIWAAGGAPRALGCPGAELAGVFAIRTRADVDALQGTLATAQRVVIIGGGYIGLEAAAVLAKLGKAVTVVEAQDRVLGRVAGEPLSRFFEGEHRTHGVDIRLSAAVEALEGVTGSVAGVRLAGGEVLAADIVIVGIGIIPSVEPLITAGAAGAAGGVMVDEYCRTSLADIFAIGDCAAHANRFAGGETIRLESVQNANDQAMTVARLLCGDGGQGAAPYDAVPWFWSNQYDLKLQTMGLSVGYDALVVRGKPETRRFSVIYLKAGRVVALDCVNAIKDYVQGKSLVVAGARIDPALLADTDVALKSMLG